MPVSGGQSAADAARALSQILDVLTSRAKTGGVLQASAESATIPAIKGGTGGRDQPIQSLSYAVTTATKEGRHGQRDSRR